MTRLVAHRFRLTEISQNATLALNIYAMRNRNNDIAIKFIRNMLL